MQAEPIPEAAPQAAVPRAKATPADINATTPKVEPIAPVETPQLPPLIQAAQEQATALYNDKPELADAFLEGIAFEIEGRKFDLTPVGSAVRSARKLGAEWYKTNGATLDATMPTAPAPLATPEPMAAPKPLKIVGMPKMKGGVRTYSFDDDTTATLSKVKDEAGVSVWAAADLSNPDAGAYKLSSGLTLKQAQAELPAIIAAGRAQATPEPMAAPSVATRKPEAPVAAPEAAASQPPAEFDAAAVLEQGYALATERVARPNQKAFRQGLEEAMGVNPVAPQEDIDKFSKGKRAAYQAGWQFVRDARGEQAAPTAISDQAIAEGVKVKKGRTASAQGLKTTSREQIYTRDTVDPEPAGDITPEQQEQQAVYGEMEQARKAERINDANFAALVTLRRRGAPSSVVREELRRLSAQDKTGVEPTREGQMRGQTMSNAGQQYSNKDTSDTPQSPVEYVVNRYGGLPTYSGGDLALVRAYARLTGKPVYVPIKGTDYYPIDVEVLAKRSNYAPFTKAELDHLIAIKNKQEEVDNNSSPMEYDQDNLSISDDIPPELAGIIRGWKKLIIPGVKVFVTTRDYVAAHKHEFTGNMRAIGSAALSSNEYGSTRMVGDGEHYIVLDTSGKRTLVLETLAHEMGHVHEKAVYNSAPEETKAALKAAFSEWLASQKGGTARAHVDSLRGRTSAKLTRIAEGYTSDTLSSYWKSFSEWYADQTARWAMSDAKPQSVVEKFFSRLGKAIRQFYSTLRAQKYLPTVTFRNYMGKVAANLDLTPYDLDTTVSEARRSTQAAPPPPGGPTGRKEAARLLVPEYSLEELARVPSLSRKVDKYVRMYEAGDMSAEEFADTVRYYAKANENARISRRVREAEKGRVRGSDFFRQRLLEAKRKGWIDEGTADMADWFVSKNPSVAADLGIKFRAPKENENAAGMYNPASRIVTLIKDAGKRNTGVHEILHHTERMMPAVVQAAIRATYDKAKKAAEKDTPGAKGFFDLLRKGTVEGELAAVDMIVSGAVPDTMYQYTNPSEFWAVNAADIISRRYTADGNALRVMTNWLSEFTEFVKATFGLNNQHSLIKALNGILKSDGAFASKDMVAGPINRTYNMASQSAPPPPGGPTGAPPSTPNAPLGGKVEIAARLQSFVDNLTRKINYKYQDAEVAQRALLAALGLDKLSGDKDFAQTFRLYESSKGGQQEVLDRQFIKPLEGAIKASGLDINDIGMYLWARSAPARNAMIAQINGEFPDGGSGLTNAEAQQVRDDLDARGLTPKLEAIAARADKLVDHMLKLRVEAGLLTQDDVDAMRAEQPFYMPLKGFAKDGDMQTDDTKDPHEEFNLGKTARSAVSEFRKAKGRKSMPFNPLLNLIVDASYATLRADTNEVGKTFLNALRAHPDEFKRVATFYTKGKPKLKYSPKDPLTGKATAFPENLRMQTDELMTVKDGGELYFIEFANTDEGAAMRRAFSNMRPEQMGKFMKGLTATTRTLKQLLTTRSPSYMAGPAFIRDVMDSYTSAVAAMTKKGGPAYGKPLAQAMRKHISPRALSSVAGYAFGKSPKTMEQALDQMLLEQMVADGGSVGHSLIKSVETYAEDAAKRLQRHAKAKEGDLLAATREKLDAVGEVMDATAQMYDLLGRFATYKAALEVGISRKDAAELALDASLNLTRRGEWSSLLDSLFFFFSPTIEGARKFKNMGLSGRNGIKVMTSFAGIGTVLTLWNLMMSGDEDDDGRPDYLDINDMTRQTRAIVYYGSGPDDYVTMPLGFMGAYPQYVGSRIAEAAYGANNEESASALIMGATADLGRGLFSAMSPVRPSGSSAEDTAGSVMPSAVKPFFDVALNRNFFDTPIYNKQFDARRARSTMGRESTEQFWHWMARSMNEMTGGSGTVAGAVDFQPEVYRYLVESFGGGPYRFLRDTVKTPERVEEDGVARALPLVRGFVGKGFEYVPMSNYYKHVNDLDAILWQEKNGTDEEWEKTRAARPVNTDPRVLDAYEAAKRELDRLARERREELAAVPPSDTEERQAIVDFYREAGRPAYEEFNRVREQVRKELGK